MDMIRGQKIKISDVTSGVFQIQVQLVAAMAIDVSCFGIDAQQKLSDERYMIFFNQPNSPCGGVKLVNNQANQTSFQIDLSKIPSTIDKLVFTAAIDGQGTMAQLQSSSLSVGSNCRFTFSGQDFADERAIMIAELYRKEGVWRLAAVGQGFNGGLDALVTHFGGEVAAPVSAPTPTIKPSLVKRVQLEKRIEQEAPQLVNLVKKAQISLEKSGLGEHRAKVCLCLDISASMSDLYSKGQIQTFIERILALACRFDDDGEVDVFLFGQKSHHAPTIDLQNYQQYIRTLIKQYPLEGGTHYSPVMKMIRHHYLYDDSDLKSPARTSAELPVYVMFVTDGATSNRKAAENQILYASFQPIFWQFMGIGRSGAFEFLEKLDDLTYWFFKNGMKKVGGFSYSTPQSGCNTSYRLATTLNL